MAVLGTAIWQKTGGSDSAGGGFDPSQTAGMNIDLVIVSGGNTASPVVSSASYNFNASTDVGHWLFIATSTSSWYAGFYQIASVASNQATLKAAAPVINAKGYVTTPGQAQSYAALATGGAYQTYATNGQYYTNTTVGCSALATQSTNKATWSIDRSRQRSIFWNATGGVTNAGGTQLSSLTGGIPVGYAVGKQDVGNIIQVLSGSGGGAVTASMFTITSYSGLGPNYVVDRSIGVSSTGVAWSMGGTFATEGGFGAQYVKTSVGASGQRLYKTGSETLSGTTVNTAGGPLSFSVSSNIWIEGFNSTCGDLGPGAYTSAGAQTSFTMLASSINSASLTQINNVVFDGNAGTSVVGTSSGGSLSVANSLFVNFSGTGGKGIVGTSLYCYAYNCVTGITDSGISGGARCEGSVADTCGTGMSPSGTGTPTRFVAFSCTSDGVSPNSRPSYITQGVLYKNTTHGIFGSNGGGNCKVSNSVFVSNGTGYTSGATDALYNCAFYNNTTAAIGGTPAIVSNCTTGAVTSDPYVGNHIGGATDLVVNSSNSTWVTTATNTTVGGGGTAQSAQDIGLKLMIYGGTSWAPGIYTIVDYDSGTGSWILNFSPAPTSTTGGSWRIADFRPNTVAGGGAALKAMGIGILGQIDNIDIGAVQHKDAGGSSGTVGYAFS